MTKTAFLIIALLAVEPAAAAVIYVDVDNARGPWDGRTWASSYRSVRDALERAGPGDEIWVAEGTYTPGSKREATFQLKVNVTVYGGFAGHENVRDERDWQAAVTVLSGDVGRRGVIDDNVYHVVTGPTARSSTGF